jgi:hypothetical protein
MAILSPDLKNPKSNQNLLIDNKKYSFEEQLITYLSLADWEELGRFLATDRVPFGCPNWVSELGVGLSNLSLLSLSASSSAQSRVYISIVHEIPYGHTETCLIDRKIKRRINTWW